MIGSEILDLVSGGFEISILSEMNSVESIITEINQKVQERTECLQNRTKGKKKFRERLKLISRKQMSHKVPKRVPKLPRTPPPL